MPSDIELHMWTKDRACIHVLQTTVTILAAIASDKQAKSCFQCL